MPPGPLIVGLKAGKGPLKSDIQLMREKRREMIDNET